MADDVQKFIRDVTEIFGEAGPEVILDVGSRELLDSISMSNAFPNAKILAFEPNPNQYGACFAASLAHPQIQFLPYACGEVEDTIDFYVVDGNCGASSALEPIHIPGDWGWSKTKVRSRRIDNVLKELGVEKVDVIWMDVQGYELKALKGVGAYINNVKAMHTEAAGKPYYVGHTDKSELETWLEQQGFTMIWEPTVGHLYEEGDILCIRK
jgi:FkbM family methyltransferase